ncbi:MAG: secretin N-terminal domain-containing protein [Phycisphaerales bacterium]|nr:secretin N-terminal domain-containing protein [Phycisphaerales bacterium]
MSEARFGWLARMFLIAGTAAALSLHFWTTPATAQDDPTTPAADAGAAIDDAIAANDVQVTFSFKDQTWDEILDFFSRTTGLPIVREVPAPKGTVTYIYPQPYRLPEALETLNILLQTQGVMLRREADRLYLQKLEDMQRENIPTFIGQIPEDVTDDQIITILVPLVNAEASTVAEQLSKLIASYGSVTAMPRQNAVLLVETAAQIRRITKIIEEVDREDVENIIEYIPIVHAKAVELVKSLTSLMGERVVKYVVDSKGKQVKVEDEQLPGLQITADPRTNAIIAKGTRARIDQLNETILLLDVPEGSGSVRTLRTVSLLRATPKEASTKLNQFYAAFPKERRPVVVTLDEVDKISIVGDTAAVAEGVALLNALEETEPGFQDQRITELLPITHGSATAAITAVKPMLGPRRERALVMVPGPDGHSIVASGQKTDILRLKELLEIIDRPSRIQKQVRFLTVDSPDPSAAVERAVTIYETTTEASDPLYALTREFDPETVRLTLTGSSEAITRFSAALEQARATIEAPRTIQRLPVLNTRPSAVASRLESLAKRVLDPRDGSSFNAPRIEAVDELDLLIVEANPSDFDSIKGLLSTLDRVRAEDFGYRVVPAASSNPSDLLARADSIFIQIASLQTEDELERPTTAYDTTTGSIALSGPSRSVAQYERALAEARKLMPPEPESRMIQLEVVAAEDIAPTLQSILLTAPTEINGRRLPVPVVTVVEPLNALYVVADAVHMAMVDRYVRELDVIEATDLPPMQLIQVRTADAAQLARSLTSRYARRPADQLRENPVVIEADAMTNMLVVTAGPTIFEEIRGFVDEVNLSTDKEPERETTIFPLKLARATDLAIALEKLYPEPPMPMDSRGRPLAHLQEPREVLVSADSATNTLIIEAPAERKQSFAALVEQLDRVKLPPQAELSTFRVERGDPNQVAETLNALARQGVLSSPSEDGAKSPEVSIQVEPATGTLIVTGDESTFERVKTVLDELESAPLPRVVRVFDIQSGDVNALATRATRFYTDQQGNDPSLGVVELEIDAPNGTIIAVSDRESMDRFANVLDELEAALPPAPLVKLIPLTYVRAEEVVSTLDQLARGDVALSAGGGPPPVFEAVPRTNSILVAAQPAQQEIVSALIERLDVQDSEMPPIRILQLRTAEAANLAKALSATYENRSVEERAGKPVRITADIETNSLVIAAHPEIFEEIQAIVTQLNDVNRLDDEGREIRIFPLKIARAEELAQTIDEMYPQPPMPTDSRGRPRPDLQLPREIVVRGDAQTNSLIVDAPIQRMPGFEKLVEQLDRAQIAEETEIRTWKIVSSELKAVASALQQIADKGGLGVADGRGASNITISTEPLSGTLLVSGPKEIFAKVDVVVASFEAGKPVPATSLRFFRLTSARADALAPMLREVLASRITEQIPGGASQLETLLEVTADRKTNTLVIQAPESVMPVAEELVKQLDTGTSAMDDPVIRVRPLTFADPQQVVSSLGEALGSVISTSTGEPIDVRLVASPGSNAIIMVGLPGDLDEVEALVEPLDARPAVDAVDAKTFELVNADATEIASVVERLLVDQEQNDPRFIMERIRRSRGEINMVPRVRVESDVRTNSLIVSGPQRTVALAKTLIEQLDRPQTVSDRTYITFTPTNADPARLAEIAKRVIVATRPVGTRSELELIPDPQTGVIVIIGPNAEARGAEAMLKSWDSDSYLPAMDLKVVDVENGDAEAIASTVGELLSDRSRWPLKLRAAADSGLQVGEPRISAERTTNRILISAPTPLLPIALELIQQLDASMGEVAGDVRVYALLSAQASDVATALQNALDARDASRPGEPKARIIAEPSSNSIVVTATPSQQVELAELVKGLDSGSGTDVSGVRTVMLKHARAEVVAPVVERLMNTEEVDPVNIDSYSLRRYYRDRYANGSEVDVPRVRVEADSRLNAVIIAAPPAMLAVAQKAVEQMDVDPATAIGGQRAVRVLAVQNADAEKLGDNLRALFIDGQGGDQPPVIQVDASSNALLVRATKEQFDVIERVTREIDDATVTTSRELSTIPIDGSRADAADIARLLERILQRGGRDDAVQVIPIEDLLKKYAPAADPATPGEGSRSLAAPEGRMSSPVSSPMFSRIIAALALGVLPPVDFDETTSVFDSMLRQDQVAEPSESSDESADSAPSTDSGNANDDSADIVIAVDPETNSLVVMGSPRAVARVRALATQAQDELPLEGSRIRSIQLPKDVSADRLRALVVQTLQSMTPSGGKRGDLARRVGVIADPGTRSLVVTATDSDFETVAAMIAAYARGPEGIEVAIRSYTLANVSADRAASGLQSLLGRGKGQPGELSITLDQTEATFDVNSLRVVPDVTTNSLLVLAPEEAFPFVDRYIQLMDQEPSTEHSAIRTFDLRYANSAELVRTFGQIYRRPRGKSGQPAPGFSADTRTNSLVVTGSAEQMKEIETLLTELDRETIMEKAPLKVIELVSASARRVAEILDTVVIGDDQVLRSRIMILPDEDAGVLLVRADPPVLEEIQAVLAEVDRDSTSDFPVRSIVLKRANAGVVARAIQDFYDDRAEIASGSRGRRLKRQIAVIGDDATSTLLIAASDKDYEQVTALIDKLDSLEATRGLEFQVFPLEHASAEDVRTILRETFEPIFWMRGGQEGDDQISTAVLPRLNALLVTGNGELFATVERVIKSIDLPPAEGTSRVVKVYEVFGTDLRVVRNMIREAVGSEPMNWWEDDPSDGALVEYDRDAQIVIVSGTQKEQDLALQVVETFKAAVIKPELKVEVLALEYAPAGEVGGMLSRFVRDRADAMGEAEPAIAIGASEAANTLIVSATRDELATIKDLVEQIDRPEASGDRMIEIIPLGKGEAVEIARLVSDQFPRRGGTPGVIVAADSRTNSLIVNAPRLEFVQVKALVEKLDGPPMRDETLIRTYVLATANADEAMGILQRTLALDNEGRTTGARVKVEGTEGEAVEVTARIVSDERSNTLVVAATQESFTVIDALIGKLEDAPSASPIEYRIIPLKHAEASDVTMNLNIVFRNRGGREAAPSIDWTRDNQLVIGATSEQFVMIDTILGQLDTPGELPRTTDFYPLEFAEADKVQNALSYFYGPFAVDVDDPAKKNVQIAADLATNSLVISASENEWTGIRALLSKLDSAEYDSSLQLSVLPLTYADARSVARAINEAFRGPIERDSRRQDRRQENDRDGREEPIAPPILVEAEEWVSAAAEEQTNSLVVSASRKNLSKIQQIVDQLDVADFMKMPPPRLIAIRTGSPEGIADSLSTIYLSGDARGGLATRIVPDESSGTIIVRAEENEFTQIKALADALQQEASMNGLSVHVLELASASADRIADVVREAFLAQAEQSRSPLSIEADAGSNTLVVACTGAMWSDIKGTVQQMDTLRPAAGQGIFLIDLQHVPAEEVGRVIEEIGLEDEPSEGAAGRMIVEPVRVSVLEGRNAILVVANPADREVIVAIAKTLDSQPELAESSVRLVTLRNASAEAVVEVLDTLFDPDEQQVSTAIADALQEQVRRLEIMNDGLDGPSGVDLAKPIRLIADEQSNAVIIASTEANVAAVEQLVGMLDTLPVTSEAIVRMFPLENIAAEQFVRITRELHDQGRSIGEMPGGVVRGIPAGAVGRALMENVALSVDERTNTVIAAGTEDAVAFVEVLVTRLDGEIGLGWVEAKVLPLRFADAEDIALLVQDVLVEGSTDLPAATPLQNQAARLRVKQGNRTSDSEIFVPMNRLIVRPDNPTNSLVVVGTPSNIAVVEGLVSMMDIESAFPGALVRIYPVENASASRLASVLAQLFDAQIAAGTLRDDDQVKLIPDERTNSLVVSTTTRSFAMLEQLLSTLDTKMPPDIREIKIIAMTNASAARVAPIVQRMMDARVERLREVQPESADLERVLVISDDRTNSLVVAAGNDTYETVRRLARDLDDAPVSEHGEIAVVPVPGGSVDRLSQAIDRIMERRYADIPGEVAKARRPLVLTDSRSSSLLVAADPADLTSIRELVAQLAEVPMNPAIGLYVVPLDRGDVEQFASRLQSLMRDRTRSLGEGETPTDEVSITADPVSRTLIVAANEDNFKIVQDLVGALVEAGAESASMQDIEILALKNQSAGDVVDLLDDMYVKDENSRRGETVIRVTADDRLNAVVVNAPGDDRLAIKRLVEQLDNTRPSQVVEIKYIPLGAANAVETVSLIENVLSGNTLAGRRGSEQATIIRYLKDIEGEESDIQTEVSTAVREAISLTPDARTNTIIVRAPRDAMQLIDNMIRDLDASSTGNQDIQVFRLANADADAMADILGELFNLKQEGSLYVLKPREVTAVVDDTGVAIDQAGALGTDLTLVPDQRQALSITVDSRTNSLLVSGTPTYLELVTDVVAKLDAEKANERETFVYPLRNAQAAQIAQVVGDFVAADQRKLIETLGSDQLPSASRLLEREVTIVGDDKSNSVLVNASPRYREKVMEMIRGLDVDPPQVMIQVLLAEITLDNIDEAGVTLNGQVGTIPINSSLSFAGSLVGGVTGAPYSISSGDLNFTLTALQSQRRFNLLANPSITVANNEQGRIQVGQTIRVPEAIATFDTGIQNTAVVAEEVGTILEVLPSINPDGFVRMQISPQISELSKEKTDLSTDFQAPIIIRRTATTTVTVRDGETVVIGGLIRTLYEKQDDKVPFFGDLPLIGGFFRNEEMKATRTELLIVLTPHVIDSPSSPLLREMSADMIERMPLLQGAKEQILEGQLDGSSSLFNGDFESEGEAEVDFTVPKSTSKDD